MFKVYQAGPTTSVDPVTLVEITCEPEDYGVLWFPVVDAPGPCTVVIPGIGHVLRAGVWSFKGLEEAPHPDVLLHRMPVAAGAETVGEDTARRMLRNGGEYAYRTTEAYDHVLRNLNALSLLFQSESSPFEPDSWEHWAYSTVRGPRRFPPILPKKTQDAIFGQFQRGRYLTEVMETWRQDQLLQPLERCRSHLDMALAEKVLMRQDGEIILSSWGEEPKGVEVMEQTPHHNPAHVLSRLKTRGELFLLAIPVDERRVVYNGLVLTKKSTPDPRRARFGTNLGAVACAVAEAAVAL